MSDEPQLIIAADRVALHPEHGIWPCGKYAPEGSLEYVRADLYAALEAERDRLRAYYELKQGCVSCSNCLDCIEMEGGDDV